MLGLGNIGPEAGLPVVEGKALLLKQFGNVDAIPIGLNSTDPDEIVNTIKKTLLQVLEEFILRISRHLNAFILKID
ncbi:hypothetical protein GCM10020331_006310 [Ectobacillus funiculus]